jgi:uncharacterized protein with ATP-grasp and redox domains
LNIQPQCIACIFNQAYKVTNQLKLDNHISKEILDMAGCLVPEFSYSKTPPQNALKMYQNIATILNKDDIYHDIKQLSIKKAKELVPLAKSLIENSSDRFLASTKMAVAGNVIDLASEHEFDLEDEVKSVLNREFSFDESDELYKRLLNSKKLAYLADNAGENEFDKLYISYLKTFFPDLEIFYFVRSKPIINDICFDDVKDDKELKDLATVVDSGNLTPGVILEDLTKEAKECLQSCDTIISKGMGNYECLSNYDSLKNLFYLLKVKCEVVANSLNLKVGDIICKEA